MTANDIIATFELYVDDTTELSSAEELALLNKVYHEVCDDRAWEFLKKQAAGTMASTTTITLPTDFGFFTDTLLRTDNSDDFDANARPVAVRVNGNINLQVVNWSDRRQYENASGYCYLDVAAGVIRTTTAQPAGATYDFDYKAVPADLTGLDSPVFPARYHVMLAHKMAVDDMIIQLFDKARSYQSENLARGNSLFQQLCKWNADLQLN